MKTLNARLICVCLMLAGAGTAFAADDAMMKKPDAMSSDAMAKKDAMTLQECKDHMAMAKKDTMAKKDDAMMKKDAMCDDMMKKDAMMKKPDAMAADPMKK